MSAAQGLVWRLVSASVAIASRSRWSQAQRNRARLDFAGFDGDGGLAAVAGEGGDGWVAGPAVAHFGEDRGGADRGLGIAEQRGEGLAVGVVVQGAADLAGQLCDLGDEWFQGGDEAEHDLSSGFALKRAGAAVGGASQPREQLVDGATSAVMVARQEAFQALLAEAACVGRAGVALEERQRDRAVDLGEDRRCAGPEALQLRPEFVGQRDPRVDEVLAGADQR